MQRWSNKATNTSCAVDVFLPPASLCHSPLFRKSGLESRLQKALRDCKGGACGSFWPPQPTAAAWAAGPKAPLAAGPRGGLRGRRSSAGGCRAPPSRPALLPPSAGWGRSSALPGAGLGGAWPLAWRGAGERRAGPGRAEAMLGVRLRLLACCLLLLGGRSPPRGAAALSPDEVPALRSEWGSRGGGVGGGHGGAGRGFFSWRPR